MIGGAGSAVLQASIVDEPFIPEGFSLIYVLTSGDELVIENVGPDPNFETSKVGKNTIHTLVYDTATLDLSIVEIGTTTGVQVNALLVQGGGSICASLDVAGASFDVSAMARNGGINVERVWYNYGVIYAEVSSEISTEARLQVLHPSGMQIARQNNRIVKGHNLLEVTMDLKNPSSIYIVKIENQVFKIMKGR